MQKNREIRGIRKKNNLQNWFGLCLPCVSFHILLSPTMLVFALLPPMGHFQEWMNCFSFCSCSRGGLSEYQLLWVYLKVLWSIFGFKTFLKKLQDYELNLWCFCWHSKNFWENVVIILISFLLFFIFFIDSNYLIRLFFW